MALTILCLSASSFSSWRLAIGDWLTTSSGVGFLLGSTLNFQKLESDKTNNFADRNYTMAWFGEPILFFQEQNIYIFAVLQSHFIP